MHYAHSKRCFPKRFSCQPVRFLPSDIHVRSAACLSGGTPEQLFRLPQTARSGNHQESCNPWILHLRQERLRNQPFRIQRPVWGIPESSWKSCKVEILYQHVFRGISQRSDQSWSLHPVCQLRSYRLHPEYPEYQSSEQFLLRSHGQL